MKIIDEKQNKLLNRKEVVLKLDFKDKATPSKTDVLKHVAGAVKAKEDAIYVEDINQTYGNTTGEALVYVYNSKADLDKIHFYNKKSILKQVREKDLADRKAAKEAAAVKEAPVEAKPAEVKVQ